MNNSYCMYPFIIILFTERLHNIFGDLIMKALWIIEYGSIIIERSKSSQHQLFRVESNSGTISYCSNYTRYCRCFNIVQKYIHHCYELWVNICCCVLCYHFLFFFFGDFYMSL
ncbi:unnamed protein product [Schistosoma spindalis]|nr:unnamed protein product [Schistosoma spindale]